MHCIRAHLAALAAAGICLSASPAAGQLPAFPGAEGYGAWARGGRGGDVYYVTTLAASGAGSFAYGVANAPPQGRTILFAVSGHIRLPSGSGGGLTIGKDRITVAGQSAPGDGICFWNNTMNIAASDLVFRHIRWRYGKQAAGGDCVDIGASSTNVVFDHCDLMFSTDENFSSFGGAPENLSFQWSCNAWGLQSHSCGGLWEIRHTTAHHTLWADNHTRNPKVIRPQALDWVNNVSFGWDYGMNMAGAETPGTYRLNVRGSYFIHGGSTTEAIYGGGSNTFRLFMSDSALDGNNNGVLDVSRSNHAMVSAGPYQQAPTNFPQTAAADPAAPGDPVVGVPVAVDGRLTAYKKVISQVGPLRLEVDPGRPLRDEITALVVADVVAQHRRIISDPLELGLPGGAFAMLSSAPAPVDTEGDGMPDYWEQALGFNPTADDHNTAFSGSGGFITGLTFFPTNTPLGYTYLEEYLHFLAVPHGTVTRNVAGAPTFLDADLRKFTAGFTNAPVFTLGGVTNGAAVLQPDGRTVRFTPATNFFGRARFDFTVTDADGSAWRQTLVILVTPSGVPRSLVWAGDGTSNDWDVTTANWLSGTNRTVFGLGDTLLFDDRGSAAPAVDLTGSFAPGALTVNATSNYTFSGTGTLYGAMALTKAGPGRLTIGAAHAFTSGTVIAGGEVRFTSDAANADGLGSGPLTLAGGVLTMYDNISTYNSATYDLIVPAGAVGSLNADGRVNLYGTLTGAGLLNLKVPYVRTALYGDWSAFGGGLNISNSSLQLAGTQGFPAAAVALGPGADLVFAGAVSGTGTLIRIGDLSGAATSTLRGGDAAGNVLTWQVGELNRDSVFSGRVAEQVTNAITAVRKVGAGTWVLTGTNHAHRGATTVSNGTLLVNGALHDSALVVQPGGAAGGTGFLRRGASVEAGGELAPGDGTVPAGTLTVSNGLTLASPSLFFDLSAFPTGANDRVQLQGGLLTMTGTQRCFFVLLDNALGAGVYNLITGGTNTAAAGVGLVHNLPSGTRQSFTLERPTSGNGECYVRLTVSGAPASLVWTGSEDGRWAPGSGTNWLSAGNPDRFFNLDHVLFNDAATNRAALLTERVRPASLVVSNGKPFSLSGTGVVEGATALVKHGTGTLTIANSNAFTGGLFLNGGTVATANDAASARGLGSGPIVFGGGTLDMHTDEYSYNSATYALVVEAGQTGRINTDARCDLYGRLAGGGTLNYYVTYVRTTLYADWSAFTGRVNVITDAGGGDLRIGGPYAWSGLPSAWLHLDNKANAYFAGTVSADEGTVIEVGALSGAATTTLAGGETGGRSVTWRVGGLGADSLFAGKVREQNASSATVVEKVGAGVWTLTGSNTYIGGTVVAGGALMVNNAVGSGTGSGRVEVGDSARLGGSGRIGGELRLLGGAWLSPGQGVGTLAVGQGLYLDPGATVEFQLGATNDQIQVGEDLTLAGTLNVLDAGGFATGRYTLVTYGGNLAMENVALGPMPPGYVGALDTGTPGRVDLVVTERFPGVRHFASAFSLSGYDRAETLTNFPLLVVLGTNVPGFDYGTFLTTNGVDLRFRAGTVGTNELPYEIENWNTAGLSRVWVRVPALASGATVRATWGGIQDAVRPAYTTNGATWAEGFLGVWHLSETGGPHRDSSPWSATSRVVSVVQQGVATGIVGGADSFNGTANHVSLPDMGTQAQVTVECWANLAVRPPDLRGLVSADTWSAGVCHFRCNTNLQVQAALNGGQTLSSVTNAVSTGSWFHAAYVVAGNGAGQFRLLLNGQVAGTGSGVAGNDLSDVNIAREYGGRYLSARVDEVRVSSVARSSNWIWATYVNIASNASFAVPGAVTEVTSDPAPGFDAYALRIADPARRGAGDDADEDGYANLLEYVTGGDPTNADVLAEMGGAATNGSLLLVFRRDTNAVDATIVVEGSDSVGDGAPWTGIATNAAGSWGGATNVSEVAGGTPVDVRVSDQRTGATNRFLRLSVTRP